MTTQTILKLTGLLLTLLLSAGCAVTGKPEPLVTTVPVCQQDFSQEFKDFTSEQSIELLLIAETEGCWDTAITAAFDAKASLPESELVKALKRFNRQESSSLFDQAAESYLTELVEGHIAYGEKQQRFLESYSRNAINKARSQSSQQLRLAQQVSWRLDRVMYARLFE